MQLKTLKLAWCQKLAIKVNQHANLINIFHKQPPSLAQFNAVKLELFTIYSIRIYLSRKKSFKKGFYIIFCVKCLKVIYTFSNSNQSYRDTQIGTYGNYDSSL